MQTKKNSQGRAVRVCGSTVTQVELSVLKWIVHALETSESAHDVMKADLICSKNRDRARVMQHLTKYSLRNRTDNMFPPQIGVLQLHLHGRSAAAGPNKQPRRREQPFLSDRSRFPRSVDVRLEPTDGVGVRDRLGLAPRADNPGKPGA